MEDEHLRSFFILFHPFFQCLNNLLKLFLSCNLRRVVSLLHPVGAKLTMVATLYTQECRVFRKIGFGFFPRFPVQNTIITSRKLQSRQVCSVQFPAIIRIGCKVKYPFDLICVCCGIS